MLTRLQHPEFGTELRALLAGRASEDREKADAVVAHLRLLEAAKRGGLNHPLEDALHGEELARVRYLRIYSRGHSLRVFFVVAGGSIWMLGLDANKRQTCTARETEERLLRRLREVRQICERRASSCMRGRNR